MKRPARTIAGCLLWLLVLGSLHGRSLAQTSASDFVRTLPIAEVIRKPANLFDLEGKTVRFTAGPDGTYTVETLPSSDLVDTPTPLRYDRALSDWVIRSWTVPLPFAFPFAGKTWNRIYVNNNGDLSFEKPETKVQWERQPRGGGICSLAAAVDSRAAAGQEQMISVFWGFYSVNPQRSAVSVSAGADRLAVTWRVRREEANGTPRGENIFQARLYPSGMVEMVYPRIAEQDGLVGLFTGLPASETRLDHVDYTGPNSSPSVMFASVDLYDAGTVLKFVYTLKGDVPAASPSGQLRYRTVINAFGLDEPIEVSVTDHRWAFSFLGPSPRTIGFRVEGPTITMIVSKMLLGDRKQFSYFGEAVWQAAPPQSSRIPGAGGGRRVVSLATAPPAATDLSATSGPRPGNVFEAFHYPYVPKWPDQYFQAIYKQFPPKDDLAWVCTDFRIDDFGAGGDAYPAVNVPIRGIGDWMEHPGSTAWLGSTRLQASTEVSWIGDYLFEESMPWGNRTARNYSKSVSWLTHEFGHRWGPLLRFHNPLSGHEQPLVDGGPHWLFELNAPAHFPLGDKYYTPSRPAASIMGGSVWIENGDGTFTRASAQPEGLAEGLSALDLHIMGLLAPDEVPDTFLLQGLREVGPNRFRGTKVPVRIQDIIAVMGPRVPGAAQAQKEFRLGFYVVHEPGRDPDPEMVARAGRVAAAVAEFYQTATGGRMKILPSQAP